MPNGSSGCAPRCWPPGSPAPQPGRDDKVVTAWNGLAITALAEAERGTRTDPNSSTPQRNARARIVDLHVVDGRLRRASLGGRVGDSAAILEDHAALATGLLTLYQLTGEASWLDAATALLDVALDHFADPEHAGRWFDTADDAEALMVRPADPLDGATPSGASLIAEALLLAAHLAAARPRRRATRRRPTPRWPARRPSWPGCRVRAGTGWPSPKPLCAGPSRSRWPATRATRSCWRPRATLAPGGAVVVGGPVNSSELLADRDRVGGADAAYVCRGRVCDLPVTTAAGTRRRAGCGRVACGACRAPEQITPDRQPLPRTASRRDSADDIAELYADDATVEDPVGGEVHIGRQAIRGFYASDRERQGANRRRDAARARQRGGVLLGADRRLRRRSKMRIDIISVMTFDDDGKIASMKAYWGPENMTQL